MSAIVTSIMTVDKHPDADRLDVVMLANGLKVVTGEHYGPGEQCVFIDAGSIIPGWLAEDMWMVKKGRKEVLVEERIIRGVTSKGIIAGKRYQKNRERPLEPWPMWREWWQRGDDVSEFLGIRRGTSTVEDGPSRTATDVRLVPSAPFDFVKNALDLARAVYEFRLSDEDLPCFCRHRAWTDPADFHESDCKAIRESLVRVERYRPVENATT